MANNCAENAKSAGLPAVLLHNNYWLLVLLFIAAFLLSSFFSWLYLPLPSSLCLTLSPVLFATFLACDLASGNKFCGNFLSTAPKKEAKNNYQHIFFKNLSPAILIYTNHVIVKVKTNKKNSFSSSISKQLVFKPTCKIELTNLRKNVSIFSTEAQFRTFPCVLLGRIISYARPLAPKTHLRSARP